MRKIIFNLHEELHNKEITKDIISRVVADLPTTGIERWTLIDGSHLMVSRRERVKNETYDLWWD